MSTFAVVRVFATTQTPDHECPWQTDSPTDATGSGVVVAPGQVLTGAHVVSNATFLRVQRMSQPDKFIARIVGICHDADLALLEVDDERFMEGVEPAALGGLPDFQDRVAVVGFPVGGDELSITAGVVSRIEVQRYSHSQRKLLAVTVDATIADGNSGGPVLDDDGRVIGIAFQTLEDVENIGEMVPAPLIVRFLEGVAARRPLQVPGLGTYTQNLENHTLRQALGMHDDESGVLVESLDFGSSAWGMLEPGDVLLTIAGQRIANNGTISYRDRFRTSFEVLLGDRYVGDTIAMSVLRGGQRFDVQLNLGVERPLVPWDEHDKEPRWYIFGGLVFQVLTRDYLKTWDRWWDEAPKEFLNAYFSGRRTVERQEIVVLSQVLADEINVGYGSFYDESIVAIDGHQPVDLEDLVRRVDAASGTLDLRTASGIRIVLDVDICREAAPRILGRYRVPRDRSLDLGS